MLHLDRRRISQKKIKRKSYTIYHRTQGFPNRKLLIEESRHVFSRFSRRMIGVGSKFKTSLLSANLSWGSVIVSYLWCCYRSKTLRKGAARRSKSGPCACIAMRTSSFGCSFKVVLALYTCNFFTNESCSAGFIFYRVSNVHILTAVGMTLTAYRQKSNSIRVVRVDVAKAFKSQNKFMWTHVYLATALLNLTLV